MNEFVDGSANIKRATDGVHIDMEFPGMIARLTKEQARAAGIALLGMSMSPDEWGGEFVVNGGGG